MSISWWVGRESRPTKRGEEKARREKQTEKYSTALRTVASANEEKQTYCILTTKDIGEGEDSEAQPPLDTYFE